MTSRRSIERLTPSPPNDKNAYHDPYRTPVVTNQGSNRVAQHPPQHGPNYPSKQAANQAPQPYQQQCSTVQVTPPTSGYTPPSAQRFSPPFPEATPHYGSVGYTPPGVHVTTGYEHAPYATYGQTSPGTYDLYRGTQAPPTTNYGNAHNFAAPRQAYYSREYATPATADYRHEFQLSSPPSFSAGITPTFATGTPTYSSATPPKRYLDDNASNESQSCRKRQKLSADDSKNSPEQTVPGHLTERGVSSADMDTPSATPTQHTTVAPGNGFTTFNYGNNGNLSCSGFS